jgi:hypothetical protein
MMGTYLQVQLWLARAGWPAMAGVLLLLAGLGVHLWWLPKQSSALALKESDYRRAIAELRTPAVTKPPLDSNTTMAARYAAFNTVLAPRTAAPDLVKTVFGEAGKAGLALAQAEYRMGTDKAGGYSSYQMILPVRGPYLKLREFVDGVLAAVPSAALEEMSFKREGIGGTAVDVRLRLVFYLKDAGP